MSVRYYSSKEWESLFLRGAWIILFAFVGLTLLSLVVRVGFFLISESVPAIKEKVHAVGAPMRLSIPRLRIAAAVEEVGLDLEGRMEVPSSARNVGWYNLGSKPGEEGNAVVVGHRDTFLGTPAVFSRIRRLKVGDDIYVDDDHGNKRHFHVMRIAQYPSGEAPIREIFSSLSDRSSLNLITCDGGWDSKQGTYSHRLVAFAEMVPEDGLMPIDPSSPLRARSLRAILPWGMSVFAREPNIGGPAE